MRKAMEAAIVAALLVAAGFAKGPADPKNKSNEVPVPGPVNEVQIAKQVRHKLVMLPYFSIFDELDFRLNGSVVTLEGACPPEPPWDIKSDAARVVKEVPGVTQVINNIRELPLSPMDWQIRRAEARAIYGTDIIGMRYGYQALPSIHIIVRNGQVTLEGVVANEADKNIVNLRANGVPNVFSVTNNLRVENQK